MTKNISSIVFFVWDDLLDYQIPLAKKLKAAGARTTMIVQTNEGGAKCYENRLPFVITDNIYKYFKVSETITNWQSCIDKLDLKEVQYRQQPLLSLCQYEQFLQKNENDPARLKKHLIKAAESIEFFYHIEDNLHPDLLFVWNGKSLPTRVFKEFAKQLNIKVYCLERGFFPETLFIDSRGVNFGSHFSKSWNLSKNKVLPSKAEEKIVSDYLRKLHRQAKSITGPENKISPEEIRKRFGIPEGKKIILYAAQIDTDTNIVFYSRRYDNNKDLIVKLENIISRHKNACLLIKLHPEDINRKNEFEKLLSKHSAIIDNISIQSLLQAVDIVVVRNSTVGLEALTYFKPVIALGSAIYSHKGLTYDVSTDEELEQAISFLVSGKHNISEFQSRIVPFLFSLLSRCLYFINGREVFKQSNQKIEQNCLGESRAKKSVSIQKSKAEAQFYEGIKTGLENFITLKDKNADTTIKAQNILLIVDNVNLPLKTLLKHLADCKANNSSITVIGHKLLKKEYSGCNCYYPFRIFNLLKCLVKPYDLLMLSSFSSLSLKMLLYLLFSRAKKKTILNPFNLKNLIATSNDQ